MRIALPVTAVSVLACSTALADPCTLVSTADLARVLAAPVIRRWGDPDAFDEDYGAPIAECIVNSADDRAATISVARYPDANAARAALDRLTSLARSRSAIEPAGVVRKNPSTLIITTREPRTVAVTLLADHWLIGSTSMLAAHQSESGVTASLQDLARTVAVTVSRTPAAR